MDVFEIDLVMELLELLELDFVLLGKVLEDMIPGLSGSKGGEGEPSLSELSSTEFLLILKLILPALVVFFSMYFGTLFDCLRVCSVSFSLSKLTHCITFHIFARLVKLFFLLHLHSKYVYFHPLNPT